MSDLDKDKEFQPDLDSSALGEGDIQSIHEKLAQEKPSPSEGFSMVPIILMALSAAVVFVGGVRLAKGTALFDSQVYDPNYVPAPPEPPVYDPFKEGKKHFAKNCVPCHQTTGLGLAGVYPPLVGSDWVTGDARILTKVVWNGLNGPIEVLGESYNGVMPLFKGVLSEKELFETFYYIRQAWGNEAEPIPLEVVEEICAEISGRTEAWTAAELGK